MAFWRGMVIAAALQLLGLTGMAVAQGLPVAPSFPAAWHVPETVTIPAGRFVMGTPASEHGQSVKEGPQHEVRIGRAFAVGKYPVTFDEWDACVADGGCGGYRPADEGWGRGRRPVINVNWTDAQAYVSWLSGRTRQQWRLLSESEWEYAARAGTTTAYWWGATIGRNYANCNGCGSAYENKQTSPVGSFSANPFGLFDMGGNVSQWTSDCFNVTYTGAPTDGSSWTSGDCAGRVIRGGSWFDVPEDLRAGYRVPSVTGERIGGIGFRVARTLSP